MKRIIALLMLLCLLVPACALAADTIRIKDQDGNEVLRETIDDGDLYVFHLAAGKSYTMSGESSEGVRVFAEGANAELTLENVQITAANDPTALELKNAGSFEITYKGTNKLTCSYQGDEGSAVALGISGDASFTAANADSTLHMQSVYYCVYSLGRVTLCSAGFSFESTSQDGYNGYSATDGLHTQEGIAMAVRDSEKEDWANYEVYSSWRIGRTGMGVKMNFVNGEKKDVRYVAEDAKYFLPDYDESLLGEAPDGETFADWVCGSERYSPDDTVYPTEEMTFTAQFSKAVTITYYPAAGDTSEPRPVSVPKDGVFYAEEYPFGRLEGKVLVCWTENPEGTGKKYIPFEAYLAEKDIHLYPQLEDAVTITYHPAEGDSSGPYPQYIRKGDVFYPNDYWMIFDPENQPAGETLAYWTENADGTGNRYDMMTQYEAGEDIDLYPQFGKTLTIAYLDQDGKAFITRTHAKGTRVMLEGYHDDLPAGKTFTNRWLVMENGVPTGEKIAYGEMIVLNRSLVLKAEVDRELTILWDYADGELPFVRPCYPGEIILSPSDNNTPGSRITGWKVSDADFVIGCDETFVAERDLTFIAQREKVEWVTLTFINGEDTWTDYAAKGEAHRIQFSGYSTEEEEYRDYDNPHPIFDHWLGDDGKQYKPGDPVPTTRDMTFTAVQKETTGGFGLIVARGDNPTIRDSSIQGRAGNWLMVDDLSGRVWNGLQEEFSYATYVNANGERVKAYPGKWLRAVQDIKSQSTMYVYFKPVDAARIPAPGGGAADLPETGDPSMLGAWAMLLGAAGAMGMKLRRKK